MPRFKYRARNQAGANIEGYAEADSLEQLKEALRQQELWVVQAQLQNEFWQRLLKSTREQIKNAELVMFTKQMAVMLDAGLTLLAALATLQESASPRFKPILAKISEEIKAGKTYSGALALYPNIFSPFFIGLIEIGEAGGLLAEMHRKIASHLEQGQRMRKKLMVASIYPSFVFGATILGIIFILTFAFPKIADIYIKNKVQLPLITRIMVGLSGFLQHHWYLLVLLVIGIAVLILMRVHRKPPFKQWLDQLALKIPLYRNFYREIAVARFTHNLALLLNSGLPILKALEIIKQLMNNSIIQGYLSQLILSVHEGEGMSGYLRRNSFFPPLLVSLTRTGEESGELSRMMLEANAFYESEVETNTQKFVALMEPLLIMFAAVSVFLVLLAFYLPMFKMFRVMSNHP